MLSLQPTVGVCIVNWNRADALARCLQHVMNQNYQGPVRVYVTDNASTDRSVEIVKRDFARVVLIESPTNTGGSGGFHLAMSKAMEDDCDLFWLLDNDAYPDPDCLSKCVDQLKSQPELGAVGVKIRIHSSPHLLQEIGGFWKPLKGTLELLGTGKLAADYRGTAQIDYSPACSLIVTRGAVSSAGPIDPRFFLFYDDVELCHRITRQGFKIISLLDTSVAHEYFGDKVLAPFRYYYTVRNRNYFFLDRMQLDPVTRLLCTARLFWNAAVEAIAMILGVRHDLIAAQEYALTDYLNNKTGPSTSIFGAQDEKRVGDIQRPENLLLIGLRDEKEINQILKIAYIDEPLDIYLLVDARDYPLTSLNSKIHQVPYNRTVFSIVRLYFWSRKIGLDLAIVKALTIDVLSFAARTKLIWKEGQLFEPKSQGSFELAAKIITHCLLLAGLYVKAFAKSYSRPMKYEHEAQPVDQPTFPSNRASDPRRNSL